MVLFNDINKFSSDLLNKNFVHDNLWEVDFKHKALNPVFIADASLKDKKSIAASSSMKYNFTQGSIETKSGSNGQTFDFRYKIPAVAGLEANMKLNRELSKNDTTLSHTNIKLGVNYLRDMSSPHINFIINPYLATWNLSATKLFQFEKSFHLHVGAEIDGRKHIQQSKLGIGFGLAQFKPDFTWMASLKCFSYPDSAVEKIVTNIYANATMPCSPQYGVEVIHHYALAKTDVSFGGLWYLDHTTNSSLLDLILKIKLSHDGKIAFSLLRKFSDNLTAIFGLQMDASYKILDPLKFGVKLSLTA